MNKYTIICTFHTYGQVVEVVEKERVRNECERFKLITEQSGKDTYVQIEVVNNETGEIREFWNNHDNKIQF